MKRNLLLLSTALSIATIATAASLSASNSESTLNHFDHLEIFPCSPLTHQYEEPHYYVHQSPAESILTICVQVSESANDDIFIEGMDSFVWTKEEPIGIANPLDIAIQDGVPNPQSRTTTENCLEGSRLCSFQTQLDNSFYESEGTIHGHGMVRLHTHIDGNSQNRRLAQGKVDIDVPIQKAESDRPPLKKDAAAASSSSTRNGLLPILSTLVLGCLWYILEGF